MVLGNYEAVQPQMCGCRGTGWPRSGSFTGEDDGGHESLTTGGKSMVASVTLTAAALALRLDVADFSAGCDLAIPANDAAASESREAEKSNETHFENRSSVRAGANSVPLSWRDLARLSPLIHSEYRRIGRKISLESRK